MLNLSGISVLDLTQRLPGPFASKELLDLGANVTKASPFKYEDSFSGSTDLIFREWYKGLNENKKLLSYKEDELQALIEQHDIIIASSNFGIQDYSFDKKAVVLVGGSADKKPMHDLNALAKSRVFSLFTHSQDNKKIDPPFLPFAGILYGSKIALSCLAAWINTIQSQKTTIEELFLDISVSKMLDLFWTRELQESGESKFLHNGLYPCYNIYQTKDKHYVALAAAEEHYWAKFCEIFNLSLKNEDRFDTSMETFNTLINLFSGLSLNKIIQSAGDHKICLSAVE